MWKVTSSTATRSPKVLRRPAHTSIGSVTDRRYRSEALEDRHVRLAAALAHGLEAVAAAGALQLGQQGGHQPGAGGAERVAEGDGAAVDVDLGVVGAGVLEPRHHHRGEGLVDLDQ